MQQETWLRTVHQRFRQITQTAASMTPGMIYGALAASTIYPLIETANQAMGKGDMGALGAVFVIASQLGGNLLAERISKWKDRSEADLQANLPSEIEANAELRQMFENLIEKAQLPQVVQAILSEADKDDLKTHSTRLNTQMMTSLQRIQEALTLAGSGLSIIATVSNSEMTAIGTHISQSKEIHHHYPPTLETKPDLRQRYLRRLLKNCNSLPLATLGVDEESGSKVTLDKLYINLDTTTSVPLSEEEKQQRKKQGQRLGNEEQRIVSALEAATHDHKLVLLGDPGGGKSTFVQKLAGWLTAAALGEDSPPPGWDAGLLPVFTVLRDLAPRLAKVDLEGISDSERDKRLVRTVIEHWRGELHEYNCAEFSAEFEEILH